MSDELGQLALDEHVDRVVAEALVVALRRLVAVRALADERVGAGARLEAQREQRRRRASSTTATSSDRPPGGGAANATMRRKPLRHGLACGRCARARRRLAHAAGTASSSPCVEILPSFTVNGPWYTHGGAGISRPAFVKTKLRMLPASESGVGGGGCSGFVTTSPTVSARNGNAASQLVGQHARRPRSPGCRCRSGASRRPAARRGRCRGSPAAACTGSSGSSRSGADTRRGSRGSAG